MRNLCVSNKHVNVIHLLRVQVIILRVIREASVPSRRRWGAASRGCALGESEVVTEPTRLLQVLKGVRQISHVLTQQQVSDHTWENISYRLMSWSDTDRRAYFIASSKCSLVISGTGSSSSSSSIWASSASSFSLCSRCLLTSA